ncbi:MAG: glycosyltransferase [Cyanobium sp.]
MSRLIKADQHKLFAPVTPSESVPLLQYWQGDLIPLDIEVKFRSWAAPLSEAEIIRLDASSALDWIKENSDQDDLERFGQCWHPAMQSDLIRVLFLARMGGVYLDGDTPLPLSSLAQGRWKELMHYCYLNNILAICINSICQPGDTRHYAVNCCIWSSPEHVKMQQWAERHQLQIEKLRIQARMAHAENGAQQGRWIVLLAQLGQQSHGCGGMPSGDGLPEPSK